MTEIADGLWLLDGYPPHLVNAYLAGDMLIDTGTRWARRRVFRQLKQRPPSLVALTHCHPDHQGTAALVCRRFGVALACHAADVPATEGRAPMLPANGILRLGHFMLSGPPRRVDRVLHEGDRLGDFRVVHAPGHTPGHVVYFRERDRVAIAGDILANQNFVTGQIRLGEPPPVFSADRDQNRRSIGLLASLRPSLVCFGHGPPLTDMRRLDKVAQMLRKEVPSMHATLSPQPLSHQASRR